MTANGVCACVYVRACARGCVCVCGSVNGCEVEGLEQVLEKNQIECSKPTNVFEEIDESGTSGTK